MKRILSLLLTMSMVLSFVGTTAFAADFDDIDGHWAESAIERWSDYGVVNGVAEGTFAPDANMTRAEMAQLYVNLLNLTEKADISAFTDVPAGAWYADAVAKCVAAGILNGTSDTTISPLEPVTREQMFVTFGRAVGLAPAADTDSTLTDLDDVSAWAEGMVNALLNAGYVTGTDNNTLLPLADINRASVVALLDQTVAAYANKPGSTVEADNADGLVLVVSGDVTVTGQVGDLVIAHGAADGSVTLEDADVTGTVTVAVPAQVNLTGDTAVAALSVDDGAQGTEISVGKDATVGTVTTAAEDTALTVAGTVTDVIVSETASDTTVSTEKGSKVESVTTSGSGTTVEGSGTVSKVEAAEDASDTTVTTPGTTVENNSSESVTTDKGTVAAGETGTTSGGTTSGGGSSGGSTGGGQPAHTPGVLTTNISEQTFYVGVPTEFTFTTTANDDAGKMVIGTSDFSDDSAIEKLEYYEVNDGLWYELLGDFGPSTGFPMSDTTSRFRVTFKTAGSYSFTASMKLADGGTVLCSTNVTFTVTDVPSSVSVVYNENDLDAALENEAITAIELGASFDVTKEIAVARAVTIDGNGFTIGVGTDSWSSSSNDKHLLDVGADGVTIKNLTLDSEGKAYGLQGYKVNNMALENVTVLNSAGSGLTVNGSSVNATGLNISGSAWGQSIDVSKGSGVTTPAALTLDNVSGLKDSVQICQDEACDAAVTVGGTRWYAENYYILQKDAFKYIYSADVTEAQHGQIRVPAGDNAKENGKLLQATMVAAPANSTIAVSQGTYDLPRDMDTAVSAGQNQTGWYFAIQQNGLKLVGEGMPVLTSTVYSANGVWSSQNLITIFGDNVTLDGFVVKCKMDSNKAIEINGKNSVLRNVEIRCNDIITHEEYLAQNPDPETDYWDGYHSSFAGSLYYSGDVGSAVLDNVYIEKSWLSTTSVTAGNISLTDVTLDFAGSWYSGYNLPLSANAATYLKNGSELTVVVDDALTDLSGLFNCLPEGAVVQLTAGNYQTDAGSWTVNKALTLEGTEGAVLKSKLAVTANGVILKNVTMNVTMTAAEQPAPITSTGDLTLIGCDISRATQVAQPYGYLVDVDGKLTAADTVFTAPYDPDTAFAASPSVIEAAEVELDGCTIATDGYGLFSQHVTKGIIKDTVFTGIEDRPTLGCFNSTVLNGLVFDGCTFEMGYNSIVAAGSFTIKNSTFDFTDTPADGAGNGINLYAQNGAVVLTDNTFKLKEGIRGINLTSAKWASGDHDASQVTITGNIFEGTGACAIRVTSDWTNIPTAGQYTADNTLNGNIVELPTAEP